MNIFLDSSALAKRYLEEAGSSRVDQLLASASALSVSVLAPAEVISALCRRRRERVLTRTQYANAKEALFVDIADAQVVGLSDDVMARAVDILERWLVRSSDALHVAGAAELGADLFVSADDRQAKVARGVGLTVELIGN